MLSGTDDEQMEQMSWDLTPQKSNTREFYEFCGQENHQQIMSLRKKKAEVVNMLPDIQNYS